jgi:hypothetical protein
LYSGCNPWTALRKAFKLRTGYPLSYLVKTVSGAVPGSGCRSTPDYLEGGEIIRETVQEWLPAWYDMIMMSKATWTKRNGSHWYETARVLKGRVGRTDAARELPGKYFAVTFRKDSKLGYFSTVKLAKLFVEKNA